jgi:hypothetical protein
MKNYTYLSELVIKEAKAGSSCMMIFSGNGVSSLKAQIQNSESNFSQELNWDIGPDKC